MNIDFAAADKGKEMRIPVADLFLFSAGAKSIFLSAGLLTYFLAFFKPSQCLTSVACKLKNGYQRLQQRELLPICTAFPINPEFGTDEMQNYNFLVKLCILVVVFNKKNAVI